MDLFIVTISKIQYDYSYLPSIQKLQNSDSNYFALRYYYKISKILILKRGNPSLYTLEVAWGIYKVTKCCVTF